MANTKTLQDLRNIFYAILKETEDTSAYPLVLADSLLNSAQVKICGGNVTDLNTANKAKLEKTTLPFLYSDKYYSSVQDSFLDADTTVWATTLSGTVTDFLSAGSLWINEDVIAYTWNTGTWFTGVTGVDFAHLSWSRISQLYALPADYASPVRVVYNNQKALSPVDYRNVYLQLNNFKWNFWINSENTNIDRFSQGIGSFYTIIQGLYLLPFQLSSSERMIHLMYEKIATAMSAGTDLATIPDAYSEQTIPFIAVWEMLYHRGEEARWLQLLNFAYGNILSMYDYYANQWNEILNNQRIKTGQDSYLNI